jgi:hypothetical protein
MKTGLLSSLRLYNSQPHLGIRYIPLNPLDLMVSSRLFQAHVQNEANMFSWFSYFAQNPIASPAVSEKVEASLTKMFDKYRGK